jgi:hypothetical protein
MSADNPKRMIAEQTRSSKKAYEHHSCLSSNAVPLSAAKGIFVKRLPIAGTSLATPTLGEDELKRVLDERLSKVFDDAEIHALYMKIAAVYGAWFSEQESRQVAPVAKAVLTTAKGLLEAAKFLGGHETGFRTHVEVETTSAAARALAHDQNIGSVAAAHEIIGTFRQEAERIGHACMAAYADLTQKDDGKDHKRLGWYDDFTALLLEIAQKAGVSPTVGKDRITGTRTGWLFKAAQALEPFLDPVMRSPTPEACGKRLERSRTALKRQKPSRRGSHLSM